MSNPLNIFGWAADLSGCGYYRVGLPLHTMKPSGHQIVAGTVLPGVGKDGTIEVVPDFDLIIGQRVCNSGPSAVWQALAKESHKLIFEIDDDLWRVHPTNVSAAAFYQGEILDNLQRNAEVANAVTVTNDHLATVLRQYNDNVYVLPNCIDEQLLKLERPRRDRVTVGWAGGVSHEVDFRAVKKALTNFLARADQVDLHFIGMHYGKKLGRPAARHTKWTEEITDYYQLLDFDIGLCPLADDEFNYSKSYIKALEYSALGIPVIASNVGPYRDFVQDGVTGFLVENNSQWGYRLRQLTQDQELREWMGANAREYARGFTIQNNVHKFEETYREVTSNGS